VFVRAAVMRGASIEVEELPDPAPGPGELLLAPLAAGICGSDLHIRQLFAEMAAQSPDMVLPIVPGHEVAGEVVAIGPDTDTDLAVGDLVTGNPFVAAGAGFDTIGISAMYSGALAELTRFPAGGLLRVPDGLDARLAALTEPLAVGVHAFALGAPTGPIVVVGTGPIGLAIIAVAVVQGRGPIIAVEPSPTRRAMAATLGADAVHEPGAPLADLVADVGYRPSAVSPLLDGEPDVATVFECVGRPDVVQSLLASAPVHSRVVLAGACTHPVELNLLHVTTNEVSIEASFAYRPSELRRALDLIAERPALFGQLITSDRPLEATAAAFDDLATDPEELKILIHPNVRVSDVAPSPREHAEFVRSLDLDPDLGTT
jgi:2-desacetyl-2-hydroxyethyl bacteriochlorophyllide A dehydrogenase